MLSVFFFSNIDIMPKKKPECLFLSHWSNKSIERKRDIYSFQVKPINKIHLLFYPEEEESNHSLLTRCPIKHRGMTVKCKSKSDHFLGNRESTIICIKSIHKGSVDFHYVGTCSFHAEWKKKIARQFLQAWSSPKLQCQHTILPYWTYCYFSPSLAKRKITASSYFLYHFYCLKKMVQLVKFFLWCAFERDSVCMSFYIFFYNS